MQQVLFRIPLHSLAENLPDIPIYGYGAMLFLAFLFCTWLAARLAKKDGIAPEHVQDLAIWVFLAGILGARITFVIQYHEQFSSVWEYIAIWDGGLVFYGSLIGGFVGFLLAYWFILRPHQISGWKMADVIAPCLALGLCLGRFGCLLNGCCYGNVACGDAPALTIPILHGDVLLGDRPAVTFPLATFPRTDMTARGYQTAAGFTLADGPGNGLTVGAVEKGSPAEKAGLKPGDVIVAVNGKQAVSDNIHVKIGGPNATTLNEAFTRSWPRGQNSVALTVRHANGVEEELTPFTHQSIGLHPTQLYESISAALLLFLLLSYLPFRRHDGELIVLFLLCYSVHRFLNEMLRDDTGKVLFNLTLSQNISVLAFTVGVGLGIYLWTRPPQYRPGGEPSSNGHTPTTALGPTKAAEGAAAAQ